MYAMYGGNISVHIVAGVVAVRVTWSGGGTVHNHVVGAVKEMEICFSRSGGTKEATDEILAQLKRKCGLWKRRICSL